MIASQGIGLAATAVALVSAAETIPPADALGWAGLAGMSGVGGLACFYLALSRGTMGLIAPLAAVIGAGLPALLSIAGGEPLAALRLVGIVVALVAVVLISLPSGRATDGEAAALRIDRGELPLVVLSGLGFAGFYIFLDASATAGGDTWWPLLVVRSAGLVLVFAGLAVMVGAMRRDLATILGLEKLRATIATRGLLAVAPLFIIAGAGDLGGNAFFLLANQQDALPVAVVLSSLYPIVTTLLAALFLRERLRPTQWLGVGLAVFGVALMGVG